MPPKNLFLPAASASCNPWRSTARLINECILSTLAYPPNPLQTFNLSSSHTVIANTEIWRSWSGLVWFGWYGMVWYGLVCGNGEPVYCVRSQLSKALIHSGKFVIIQPSSSSSSSSSCRYSVIFHHHQHDSQTLGISAVPYCTLQVHSKYST